MLVTWGSVSAGPDSGINYTLAVCDSKGTSVPNDIYIGKIKKTQLLFVARNESSLLENESSLLSIFLCLLLSIE